MPRGKSAKPKAPKAVSKSQARRQAAQAAPAAEEAPEPKGLPEFHGHMVVEVLEEGHTATQKHCRMDDGTTQHVPNELF